jgi:hypothetical protein
MSGSPSQEQQNLYRVAFVKNCFILLVRAYGVMETHSLKSAEEPHITGELVRCARTIAEGEDAAPWMEHMEVLDDPPQAVAGRHGKRRPRIDIELVRTGRGMRPRFHIEAKRLYRSDSVNEYFGPGGLQMFVNGEYAGGWSSAGMLGYVQCETCAVWLHRLASGFVARRAEIRASEDFPDWAPAGWKDQGLDGVHTSQHDRHLEKLGPIRIFHFLLDLR